MTGTEESEEAASGCLSGPEIIVLSQALDAVIPFSEETRYRASEVDRHLWNPHHQLRRKLKAAVHMSFFAKADGWLESELRREREAITDKLFSRLAELMRDPKATRRTVRECFAAAMRELRAARQSPPLPLSDPE